MIPTSFLNNTPMSPPLTTSPQPQSIVSPSTLQNHSSASSPRYESAFDIETGTGLSPPSKRVKTIQHENSRDNSEEEENGYSENEDSDSEDNDDDDNSDGEYILGLPRAQPNSNRTSPA